MSSIHTFSGSTLEGVVLPHLNLEVLFQGALGGILEKIVSTSIY